MLLLLLLDGMIIVNRYTYIIVRKLTVFVKLFHIEQINIHH